MGRAVIVSSGNMDDYAFYQAQIQHGDFIICADGGFRHLCAMGVKPDVFLGDFDSSCREEILSHPLMEGTPVLSFARMKNETDTHNAVLYALENGYQDILLLGCAGTRLDHTLSNLYLLKLICQHGGNGVLLTEHNRVQVTDTQLQIKQIPGYHLSLLAMSDQVTGLTTAGLVYPLQNFTLRQEVSRGISNEFAAPCASVEVQDGWLMVIESID